MTVYNRHVPEAYRSLFDALKEEGALDRIRLTLNLDSFDDQSEKVGFHDNSIIIYVPNERSNSEAMQKIARAIQKAKQSQPWVWTLGSTDLIKAKDSQICDTFKILFDDMVGFVEMPSNNSYDTTDRIEIVEELMLRHRNKWNRYDGQEVLRRIKKWTPQNQGFFDSPGLKQRRKYMPGLIFEESSSRENNIS